MTFTDAAKALLKRLEGCRLVAYLDKASVWTIGFGHTGPEVIEDISWSQERADATLDKDVARFVTGVSHLLELSPDPAPALTDAQFSALVIFAYNEGLHALAGSTLWRLVQAGHFDAVPAALRQWKWEHNKAGQLVEDPILVKRREAEIKLWSSVA